MYYTNEILDLNAIPQAKTLVGYIYGGIESSAPNIFFINDGTQSWASNVIFEVYINKSSAGLEEAILSDDVILNVNVYPNPANKKLTVDFYGARLMDYELSLADSNGKIVQKELVSVAEIGMQETVLKVGSLAPGAYTLTVFDGLHGAQVKVIKK